MVNWENCWTKKQLFALHFVYWQKELVGAFFGVVDVDEPPPCSGNRLRIFSGFPEEHWQNLAGKRVSIGSFIAVYGTIGWPI